MPFSIRELIEQFLTSRRVYAYETEAFVRMKHDHDLVAGTDIQLSRIAEAYGFFTALTFETQGLNDNGSDVSIRYRDLGSDEDAPAQILGFQIKSHVELAASDVMAKLKAQRDDAFRKIPNLTHYYILLCADENGLKTRLNAIRAEFLGAERTTVVSPTQALPFLRYEPFQVNAQVKRMMDKNDRVLTAMRESLDMPSDTAKAVACYLSAHLLFAGTPTVAVSELRGGLLGQLYNRIVDAARERERRQQEARKADEEAYNLGDEIDYFEDEDQSTLKILSLDSETALADDIEQLEREFVEQSSDGNSLTLMNPAAAPVIAVASDAMVRYDYGLEDVVPYLLDLAGVEL